MTSVKGPGPVGGAGPPSEAGEVGEARSTNASPAVGPAEAAAAGALEPAAVTRLFDEVAARLAAGEIADRDAAFHEAVAEVLGRSMPALAPAARAELARHVADVLAEHPAWGPRLARLLEPSDPR